MHTNNRDAQRKVDGSFAHLQRFTSPGMHHVEGQFSDFRNEDDGYRLNVLPQSPRGRRSAFNMNIYSFRS